MPDAGAGEASGDASEPAAILLPGHLAEGDEVEAIEVVDPDDADTDERLVGNFRSRTGARERALGLLYEAESKGMPATQVLDELPVPPDPYAIAVVRGVAGCVDELDSLIERTATNWTLARMPRIDVAVLRLAVYELAHRPDVPVAVVINEAVELAKQFSTDDSGRFVNGILSKLATQLR